MSVASPMIGRVLVVDDEPEVGRTVRDVLVNCGYVVKTAVTGREALRLAEIFRPDVVLLDIAMPGMNGLEVFERLRVDHPSMRVVMMTANQDVAVARDTLATGAFDYLPKPFQFELLERVVAAAVSTGPPPDARP
jgi:CheY-like chemotaxis protein